MPALVVTRIKLCSSLCLTVVLSWPKVKELQTLWGHSAFTKENASCVIILFLKLQLHHILFPFLPTYPPIHPLFQIHGLFSLTVLHTYVYMSEPFNLFYFPRAF